ncbi:DUF6510 family protein [Nocardioides mesophilus]|uniref:Uncharacterized protein n=1 Tax=Nocardioides mesophilus TaxID=433659 RepID=A0A7G9RDZ6_9ACTN|nr:DUF6510 family protein [Nocardioides mesophilus]QNN53821.1 hypothetical protein H9L09_05290 [Nocardioides mesophilus]
MSGEHEPLDGNAAAGTLAEAFGVDLTAARGECLGCGARAPLAATVAYRHGEDWVLRCRGCDAVLLRVVRAPDRVWVELGGLRSLRLPASPERSAPR